ncbi:PAS/PAC sensor hybrid histidine kinase [Magnetococcus marinus MC-1]|uniref:histidine kinase n=1 Tax=Magnetococcus marinus (strain ATCC BAA-1437 / JCM 17883 / MC-1) TaxID=156889 RepID=A0LD37_MAGMM|nr:response regulator [Magnetococcus marinus]ABK45880.1 PAS/PAC sensor hybrid histidine kinase [Magnetococcus marinus MC-1]
MNSENITNISALRSRAEEVLKSDTHALDQFERTDLQTLIHDLRVHQIELEMQNDELRITQERLIRVRQESDQLRECFSRLFNEAPTGYLVVDHSGIVQMVNETFLDLLQAQDTPVIGKPFLNWIDARDRSEFLARYTSFFNKPTNKSLSLRLIPQQGLPFYAQLEGKRADWDSSCLGSSKVKGNHLLVVVSDVTPLIDSNLAMQRAKAEAEQANQIKDKFISLVAHDLRGPLSSIVGLLEYLMEEAGHVLEKEHMELIQVARNSGNSLLNLTEKILNISRLNTGLITLKQEFIDAYMCIEECLPKLEYMRRQKRLRIINNVPPGTRIFADPVLYGEVIQNLLSNAIKFSHAESAIRFEACPTKPGTIVVKDEGVGIAPDLQTQLFDAGSKTSMPGTDGEKGSGFALPFCANIIESHGGDITVWSELGKGSHFTVTLPHIRPRILIVDDDQDIRTLIKTYLNILEDCEFFEAWDGQTAYTNMVELRPDLVLCDVYMPLMDGFQLLKKVRSTTDIQKIPIIMITSDRALETQERLLRKGAYDVIVKPLNGDELLTRVRRIVW